MPEPTAQELANMGAKLLDILPDDVTDWLLIYKRKDERRTHVLANLQPDDLLQFLIVEAVFLAKDFGRVAAGTTTHVVEDDGETVHSTITSKGNKETH
jgi:hypothetical protein